VQSIATMPPNAASGARDPCDTQPTDESMPETDRTISERLAPAYASVIAAVDAVHRQRVIAALVLGPLVTVLLVAINRFVFLDFPNSGDEYNYLYEARTLATGRLWNVPPVPPEPFETSYVVHEPGRAFSSFPFGWPLVLALAIRVGVPPWLVNPLLGTLTLGLVWSLGARLYSGRVGVAAAFLLGVSPFFLFNAASYFSHTFCGALLLGAASLASATNRKAPWVPVLVGFAIGWAVVTRYLTGVLGGVPILLWLLRPGVPRLRLLGLVALGGLPWVVALAAYNAAMTGSMWRLTTTPLTVSLWFRDGFLLRGADILSTQLLRHLLWTPAALLVAYVVYLRTAAAETRRAPLEWMLVLTVVILFFYVERGGNQYGPRFHYEAYLFAVIFAAANLFRAPTLAGRPAYEGWLFALVAVSVLVQPISLALHARIERQVIVERMDPFMRASGLRDALVLIGGRVGTRRSMGAADLTRNGIGYDGPVLYGLAAPDGRHCDVARRIHGRLAYLYEWDHANARGVLSPLACDAGPP
jgi:hypothetical protein